MIPLHELAERTSFVQFAVAHIAQMWHELCSCRQAARILAIFVHFVISRLDFEWGRTLYLEEKYSAMCIEAEKKIQSGKFIADRFLYFKGMLEADASVELTY